MAVVITLKSTALFLASFFQLTHNRWSSCLKKIPNTVRELYRTMTLNLLDSLHTQSKMVLVIPSSFATQST